MNKLSKNFGYLKVKPTEKTRLVQKVFSDVAKNYDLMNDILSFGTHRIWKKKLVEIVNPGKNEKIIDIGSGTGDIAKNILKTKFEGELHLLDLNKKMLKISKSSLTKNKKIFFHHGDAEKLKFKDNVFDKYIISFCLRNITNIEHSIREAYRILKPGGIYFCLEFSKPQSIFSSVMYKNYRNKALPFIGKVIANNSNAYKYLSESIELFPNQNDLSKILNKNGFKGVSYTNLFNGIVSIHKCYKF